jgi:hypothetical protein
MLLPLSALANVQVPATFRGSSPKEASDGNVHVLTTGDLFASQQPRCERLPRILLGEKYMTGCLSPGDVVLPSRGDRYRAWRFDGTRTGEAVFPMGLHVIRPHAEVHPGYLAWYINQRSAQAQIALLLTGSNIKALTKAALLKLEIEVPSLDRQHEIADLEDVMQRIIAIRNRISEIEQQEVAYATHRLLHDESAHA